MNVGSGSMVAFRLDGEQAAAVNVGSGLMWAVVNVGSGSMRTFRRG